MATPEEAREANIALRGIGSSAEFVSVTPSDAADLPLGAARALFVGVAGDVVLVDMHGNQSLLVSADSQYHPLRARRILATGTTATDILALY